MVRCLRCGKEIPYAQTATNIHFYHTCNDMDEEAIQTHPYSLGADEELEHLRFEEQFIIPRLCYDCGKELEEMLDDFINEEYI
jgi:DNA-directed RNA polymerase subunit N (RpoN/RPB10)